MQFRQAKLALSNIGLQKGVGVDSNPA